MLSEGVFDYEEIRQSETFGVKCYQNAIYRGELNEAGLRNGRGIMVYDSGRIYEGLWDSDRR